MINLRDEEYADNSVKVFNNGVAGEVVGVTMKVSRKTPADNEKAPDYKITTVESNGAIVEKGFYRDFTNWKESRLNFFVKEMKHLYNLMGVEFPTQVESYEILLDWTMSTVSNNCTDKKFNVFVSYGTPDYPKRFLEISSCFQIEPEGKSPYKGKNPLMERPNPDNIEITGDSTAVDQSSSASDLPWKEDK